MQGWFFILVLVSFFGWLFSETAPCISYTWRCFFDLKQKLTKF